MHLPPYARFLLINASFALAAATLSAQSAAPAAPAVAVSAVTVPDATLLSYAQLASPQVLARDIMGIARQVAPGMQTEMMPMLVLGKFGYPTFPGVSTDTPVVVLVFSTGGAQNVVIGLQMTPDSPVRNALGGLRMPLINDPATGWTFLSPSQDLLTYVQAHAADLVKLTGQPIPGDVLWTFPTTDLSFVRNGIQSALQAQASAGVFPTGTGKWVDFGLQQLQQLQFIQVGLDLKPDVIHLTVSATAQPGTAIAKVLSAPAGGAVPAAQFVSADAPMLAVMHEDVPSVLAYTNQLLTDAQTIAGPNGKQLIANLQSGLMKYGALSDGTAAEAISFPSPGAVQAEVLGGGNITDASIVDFLQSMYPQFITALIQHFNAGNGTLMLTNITLNLNAGNVSNNIPVHEVVTTQTLNTGLANGTAAQQKMYQALSKQSASLSQSNDMYFAAVNGYSAQASSMAALGNIATAVQAGQPVPDNVASVLTLSHGEIMSGQMNLAQIISGMLTSISQKTGTPPKTAAINALNNASVPPLTFNMTTGSNQGQMQFNLPVNAIVTLVQAMQARPAPVVTPAPAAGNSTGASAISAPTPVVTPAPAGNATSN